mmetsp:Transcript_65319/g.199918  ORF Transcript_65319/g.199918 Transcript_65319/m.199918 type:complete len:251 (-) Transcript_65319:1492-2244(-)
MGCTSTPMAMPLKRGMPAAWRLCTARKVNMLPHTCSTARSSSAASRGFTPRTESCRPAPETPSRSSLLADERTATRSVPLGSPSTSASRTAFGTLHCATASLADLAQSAMRSGVESSARWRAWTAASTALPCTAFAMTPKGTARPFGARNPAFEAIDSSFPEDAALEPAVCGESASDTAVITFCSATLIFPSLAAPLPPLALAFASGAVSPFSATAFSAASPTASTRTSPLAVTSSFTAAPSAAVARRPS